MLMVEPHTVTGVGFVDQWPTLSRKLVRESNILAGGNSVHLMHLSFPLPNPALNTAPAAAAGVSTKPVRASGALEREKWCSC